MKATVEINDSQFDKLIKQSIDTALGNINLEKLIENKVNARVDEIIKKNLSCEKVDSFARDRISRILTTESLKDYTFSLEAKDVLSNVEEKILLMIKNSKDFKVLVKQTMKNSL